MRGGTARLQANVQSAGGKSDRRGVNGKQTRSAGSCSAKKFCTAQGFLWYPIKMCYNLATLSVTPGKWHRHEQLGSVASALRATLKKNRCRATLRVQAHEVRAGRHEFLVQVLPGTQRLPSGNLGAPVSCPLEPRGGSRCPKEGLGRAGRAPAWVLVALAPSGGGAAAREAGKCSVVVVRKGLSGPCGCRPCP